MLFARWRLIVHLKQRLTYQVNMMTGWHVQRGKTKRLKKFQSSSLEILINRQHSLAIHSILLANSTANIVIHTVAAFKKMITPRKQHEESKSVCFYYYIWSQNKIWYFYCWHIQLIEINDNFWPWYKTLQKISTRAMTETLI